MVSTAPTHTVLVVEDEPLVRMVAVEIVEDGGHAAVEADRADAALKTLEAHPEITVLFSDVNMPGMDGFQLAEEVHRRRPDVALVLTSGQAAPGPGKPAVPCCRFVPKPYMPSRLLALLRELPRPRGAMGQA